MKYFKNTSWLFGEKILRMVIGLLVGIWVARYLGPEQFGLFSYAQSFVGLFAAIATLGLDGIVVRELVKNESRTSTLIGTAFRLKLIGALVTLLVLAIAINFTSNDSQTNILIFIIASATIFQSFNVVDMYFQAKVLSKFVVYVNVISLFLSSIVKIALILNEASLISFAWVVLFDSFVLAFGFAYVFLKNSKLNIHNSKFNKMVAIDLLKDSWPLILSGIVISIYMKIDQVMIKEM
ncbi:MAG: flippase, partial [Gammaproteobacteria bacterium]|nr:flippase [Gammaproteobacteria bacterium]